MNFTLTEFKYASSLSRIVFERTTEILRVLVFSVEMHNSFRNGKTVSAETYCPGQKA